MLSYWNKKYIRKPVIVKFRTHDGKIIKFSATRVTRKKNV